MLTAKTWSLWVDFVFGFVICRLPNISKKRERKECKDVCTPSEPWMKKNVQNLGQ